MIALPTGESPVAKFLFLSQRKSITRTFLRPYAYFFLSIFALARVMCKTLPFSPLCNCSPAVGRWPLMLRTRRRNPKEKGRKLNPHLHTHSSGLINLVHERRRWNSCGAAAYQTVGCWVLGHLNLRSKSDCLGCIFTRNCLCTGTH